MASGARLYLLLAAAGAVVLAASTAYLVMLESRGGVGSLASGMEARLSASAEARLEPTPLLGNRTVERVGPGGSLRVPLAVAQGLVFEPSLSLPPGARVAEASSRLYLVVYEYRVPLEEREGLKRLSAEPLDALNTSRVLARLAGLPEPRNVVVEAVYTARVEAPNATSVVLEARASATIEPPWLRVEASRAAAASLAPPRPREEGRRALYALAAMGLGAAGLGTGIVLYARSRPRLLVQPGAAVEAALPSLPVVELEDPERVVEISERTGRPLLLDKGSGRICVAVEQLLYCSRPQGGKEGGGGASRGRGGS